jgi:site-specific recombinase XerD
MPIIKLTQPLITTGLQCPPGKHRLELCDTELPGLYVEVRETSPGQGTYYLRYKTAGKTSHQKLGRTTELTLAEARRKAKALKAEIQLGADPRGEERAKRAVMTLSTLFDEHYLPYVRPRKRSWKRDVELFRRIRDAFGDRRLTEITRQQIQTFHASLLTEHLSHASADHHVKLIRQMLNLAIEWDLLDKNPAARVPLFNVDNKVEHYLDEEQLDRLLTVLRTDENRAICQVAMFLLSTGCRLNEALRAQWAQIDRSTRVWRIPASNSKSKRVRSVPLNDSALQVLTELGTENVFEHLFVNHQSKLPYTTVHKVWGRLRRKAGLPHLRIHDLRHQYASFLVNSGRTLYEVQQILGHSDPSVTQRYAHLSSKALQDAANSASIAIRGASTSTAIH